jgi:hypothetical protein
MESTDRKSLLHRYGARANTRSLGHTIPDAYLFFHQAISDWLEEADGAPREKKIAALYSALRDNVRLVVIDLDEKDDAQLIFETLNARGTPLLAADLVKNSLLNEIQGDGGNVETAYKNTGSILTPTRASGAPKSAADMPSAPGLSSFFSTC